MQIETIINRALALDPNAAHYLKKLQGRSLEIFLTDIEKTFLIVFTNTGVFFDREKNSENLTNSDACIHGPIKAFIQLALTKKTHEAAQRGLSFDGDFNTVEAIQQLFLSLNIDWFEAMSPWTGDILAHQIERLVKYTKQKNTQLLNHATESLSEYLQEESLILPTQLEVNRFLDDVDVIRADVDRLQARLDQLGETMV